MEKHPTIIKYKEQLERFAEPYELAKLILSTNGVKVEAIDEEITRCIDKLIPQFVIRMSLPETYSVVLENTSKAIETIKSNLEQLKAKENLVTHHLNKNKLEEIFVKEITKQFVDCTDILESFEEFQMLVSQYEGYDDEELGETITKAKELDREEEKKIEEQQEKIKADIERTMTGGGDIEVKAARFLTQQEGGAFDDPEAAETDGMPKLRGDAVKKINKIIDALSSYLSLIHI